MASSEAVIPLKADTTDVDQKIDRAKQQLAKLKDTTEDVTGKVDLTVKTLARSLALAVNMGVSAAEVFGFAIDEQAATLLQIGMLYVQQMYMIATSESLINPGLAAILVTAASALQAKITMMVSEEQRAAKEKMGHIRSVLMDMNSMILTLSR